MGIETPRKSDLQPESLDDPAGRAIWHLLDLASEVEGTSRMRARIVRSVGQSSVMRSWNPSVQRETLEVTCDPQLAFWLDGEVLGQADRPEDTAKILIDRLKPQV